MILDLRSDTVTKPTQAMRDAMARAEVGDDVYGDDPTVNELEKLSAQRLGKAAALFVPSGTMGNLIAMLSHTTPGQELILGNNAHIHIFEVSGYARIAGLATKLIDDADGKMNIEDIENNIQKRSNLHHHMTGLICLENSHNVAGGIVKDTKHMQAIKAVADEYHIPVHLDGARIFNAAEYLSVDVSTITKHVDSVMMCLSKGLGAPVGSILAGNCEFIQKARHNRKMLGGGMRQAGILAAAGIIALNDMPSVLKADHENAKVLALGILEIQGFNIDIDKVHTNIVMVDVSEHAKDAFEIADVLTQHNILTSPFSKDKWRITLNHHITCNDIQKVVSIVNELLA